MNTSKVNEPAKASQFATASSQITVPAVAASVILLVALHILKPDYNPLSRFISEYTIGEYGWLMQLAFILMGIASLSIAAALWGRSNGFWVKLGLAMHVAVAVSMFGAASFTSDPASTPPALMTLHGKVHIVFAMLGIPSGAVAGLVLAYAMTSRGTAGRRLLIWPAWALALTALSMIIYMNVIAAQNRVVGPDDFAGVFNRFVVAASFWWWLAASRFANRQIIRKP